MEASILLSRILRLSTLAGFCLSPADPPMTDQDCGRARRNFAGIPDAAARTPLLAIGAPCSAKQAAANLLINCSLDSEQASMPPWSATMALEMSRYLRAMVLRPSRSGSIFEPFVKSGTESRAVAGRPDLDHWGILRSPGRHQWPPSRSVAQWLCISSGCAGPVSPLLIGLMLDTIPIENARNYVVYACP